MNAAYASLAVGCCPHGGRNRISSGKREAIVPAGMTRERSNLQRTADEISAGAYEVFLERGETHGNDLDDWLQAERELTVWAQCILIGKQLKMEKALTDCSGKLPAGGMPAERRKSFALRRSAQGQGRVSWPFSPNPRKIRPSSFASFALGGPSQ
jgi:Protein of unknown function (DUF2934)